MVLFHLCYRVQVGIDEGEYKEITSFTSYTMEIFILLWLLDNSGSDNVNVSQSYQLNVGKYLVAEVRYTFTVHLLWMLHKLLHPSFSNAWTGSGDISLVVNQLLQVLVVDLVVLLWSIVIGQRY